MLMVKEIENENPNNLSESALASMQSHMSFANTDAKFVSPLGPVMQCDCSRGGEQTPIKLY